MKNKILIYDDNCPLCTWYSGLFVKYGLLAENGRKPFSTLDRELVSKIDFNRGRNEIPLLDTSTNSVAYGIDALLVLLSQKISIIKTIGNAAPVNWTLKKLYKLISFNRKVIVAQKCRQGNIDCTPDTNYFYRFLFMAFSLLFNTIMLFPLQSNLFDKLSYYHLTIYELQSSHFALVIANCVLGLSLSKERRYEYLGQVNMLALTVILLLIPLLFIRVFFIAEWFSTLYLILAAIFSFKEYIRRMEYAGVLVKYKWVVSMNFLCLMAFILFLFH